MLTSRFDGLLVVVSILVAILASYTALNMADRVTTSHGRAARWWLVGGAFAMGIGIWSMHFVGMLAFRLPIRLGYDLWITLASLLIAVAVSGLALWQVSQPELPRLRLVLGSVLMGIGIAAMHYTGMAAMRMQPGILYDAWLFAASIVIAISAAGAALWIAFTLRKDTPHVWLARAGAAVVMGAAIAGMHYTGMAAANFRLGSLCTAVTAGFSPDGLAFVVVVATVAVLIVALLTSIFDAQLESRACKLAISQAAVEERQVLLAQERIARTEVERLSEMKDEFLATLSHELRTPLSAILGWSELLLYKTKAEGEIRTGLEVIERNARAQVQLIEDLLDMSKITSGKISLDMQPVNAVSFINAAMETIRPAANIKGIFFETQLNPNAGLVSGDQDRLQQVMWNLLSNAVKFTPDDGKVQVMLERIDSHILIKVIDTGIGIPPGFLPHVFDRFRQADASTTRRYGGLGLGLSIVKHLVELHGGTVEVMSHGDGSGTTFSVRLPLLATMHTDPDEFHNEPQDEARNHAKLPKTVFADPTPLDLSGVKVLVIDDEPDARDLIARILANSGAEVLVASTADEVLQLVEQQNPQVFVSDIGMPDVDGFELFRRIRVLGPNRGGDVPAIALTAFARSEDRMHVMQAGFTGYLSKPVDSSELVASVANVAGRTCVTM